MRSNNRISNILTTALILGLSTSCGVLSSKTKEAAPAQPTSAVVATPFAGEVGMGVSYLQTRAADLVEAVEGMIVSLENRDIKGAQQAYFEARAPYEEIEIAARAFPQLHKNIDARAWEYPSGELDADFRGFHRIEVFLFSREKTQPALPYAKLLLEDVEELDVALADRSRYDAALLFDAMIDRAGEVAARTICGEEEMWSDQTLLVIRHSWNGIHAMYRHFAGDIRKEDVKLAERIDRSYRKAVELIREDFPIGQVQGAPYSIIDKRKRRAIADASLNLRGYLIKAQAALDLVDA